MFSLEAMARLATEVLQDAGLEKDRVDGLAIAGVPESPLFGPSAVAEYLGVRANFAEVVDLGGATACGMVWRASAAIEVGVCDAVLILCPMVPPPTPANSGQESGGLMRMPAYLGGDAWGSSQGQFDIPSGLVAATPSFAMAASRYHAVYDLKEETRARIAVDARVNALANPQAIFHDKPITVDDVLGSPMVADPLHKLEIVMPCFGGAALLVTSAELAKECRHRPVWIAGYGEHLTHKGLTYAPEVLDTPVRIAAERAFAMAGTTRQNIDLASMYDCYTITIILTIEDAGFCKKGAGGRFIEEHDLTWQGDWPLNTHGGQLGMGQAGIAGGLSHAVEAVRQIQGRADGRQLTRCDSAYVNGTGGMLAEQVALILEGA